MIDALRITTAVGPGRPEMACLSASCAPIAASFGVVATVVYFVIALKMAGRSMLPYSPAPDWFDGCCARSPSDVSVSTTIGELLRNDSMMPNVAFDPMNSPCPMITAGRPVMRPYASAITAAVPSCRTKIGLMRESYSASKMAIVPPPGSPKTYSTPASSRIRTIWSFAFGITAPLEDCVLRMETRANARFAPLPCQRRAPSP